MTIPIESKTRSNSDVNQLYHALALARIHRGFCAPNPSVGAVITNAKGDVIATGYHLGTGTPHAEIVALKNVNALSHGINGTLYVTLEPCCHWGRTPPCTEALIQSGIKRVVYGYRDPNPLVAGKGQQALQAAGIVCEHLPLADIESFYASYQHWLATQRPFVTAKLAMTLNGKIAGPKGERIQITGETLHAFTHASRKTCDAILTTAKTVHCDNPQLNARSPNEIVAKPIYLLDSQLTTPLSAAIFSTAKTITLFHHPSASIERQQRLLEKGARCIAIPPTAHGLSLPDILQHMGQEGLHDVWVEAGGTLFSSLINEQLLQRAFLYIAPQWLREGMAAFPPDFSWAAGKQTVHWKQMGNDVLCEIHW